MILRLSRGAWGSATPGVVEAWRLRFSPRFSPSWGEYRPEAGTGASPSGNTAAGGEGSFSFGEYRSRRGGG
ncbi:MAG: hypothetical protein BMS9Abin07_1766 [Acidimicrobiia bacterium]|nr:MAG: hypothetical protein BMS9Abin07_1766 [Acidimicrobiia bacterium]